MGKVANPDADGGARRERRRQRRLREGPGIDVSIPVFNRNQGGRLRAEAELERAHAAFVHCTRQVGHDVREASTLFDQARESRARLGGKIVTPLANQPRRCREIAAAGESSYLFVLENSRRLIEARVREREIAADEQRAPGANRACSRAWLPPRTERRQ